MKVCECIQPGEDEIVFPKTSSSVFISTNIDYVLRCLGVRQLILAGCLTDQCVESAVRDACDLHYLVTLASGACHTCSMSKVGWGFGQALDWAAGNVIGNCNDAYVTACCKHMMTKY